ncbi:hypothetical protein [Hyphomonas sp.]|uniref:hypothetical protein n=1 Tax=Hyphomonas sp. TaxID=87 RepID=UPI0025C6A7A9|nr:hypothetical protein [Hyphomonas sp.]
MKILEIQSLGEWHDALVHLRFSAPDKFLVGGAHEWAPDQSQALSAAFERLKSNLQFVRKKLKNDRMLRVIEELIAMSFEAFKEGDERRGSLILGEIEGMIWPSHKMPVKHAPEAEQRVFGQLELFAGVRISPYPLDGDAADLGSDQATLLNLAYRYTRHYQRTQQPFRAFAWVIDDTGAISRTSAEPKEDDHPILQPVQRSYGYKRLKELARNNRIRACVLVEGTLLGEAGSICYNLEQRGRPKLWAAQAYSRVGGKLIYEAMRFTLRDSDMFSEAD